MELASTNVEDALTAAEFAGVVVCTVGIRAVGAAITLNLCGDLVTQIIDFAENVGIAPALGEAKSGIINGSA